MEIVVTGKPPMNLPPTINAPQLWQLLQWIFKPIDLMNRYQRECGDTFRLNMSGAFNGLVFTSDPKIVQQVLTNDTKQFLSLSAANQILKPFLGSRGVILLEGEEHRQRRQLVMPQFHGEKVKAYTNLMRDITKKVVDNWQIGSTVNVRAEMQSISLAVILQAVFGVYQGERYEQIKIKMLKLLSLVESPLGSGLLFFPSLQKNWGPWGKFLRDRAALDELIYAEIADRRRDQNLADHADILSMLIGSQDAAGQGMTDEELHDELMTLLFAGHETTATALSWAIYWINYLPAVKEKLLAELATADDDALSLSRLPYLSAICSETLRIHPVAMLTFVRIAQEPLTLKGFDIPAGTPVTGCIYLTHHRSDLYPDPESFKPERFIDRQYSPYEFYPFGGGARRCIGMALAQQELKLVLVEVLRNCQLELTGKLPIVPVRRGVTLGPAGGVTAKVISKHPLRTAVTA
jgi:cytochrome P450 family 110